MSRVVPLLAGDELPTQDVTDLVPGVNELSLTLDHSPVTLEISGTALYNGVAPNTLWLRVDADLSDGTTWTVNRQATSFDLDGAYTRRITSSCR